MSEFNKKTSYADVLNVLQPLSCFIVLVIISFVLFSLLLLCIKAAAPSWRAPYWLKVLVYVKSLCRNNLIYILDNRSKTCCQGKHRQAQNTKREEQYFHKHTAAVWSAFLLWRPLIFVQWCFSSWRKRPNLGLDPSFSSCGRESSFHKEAAVQQHSSLYLSPCLQLKKSVFFFSVDFLSSCSVHIHPVIIKQMTDVPQVHPKHRNIQNDLESL